MGRMGTEPILPVKWSVSTGTMINFDGDSDGDGTCKQILRLRQWRLTLTLTGTMGYTPILSVKFSVKKIKGAVLTKTVTLMCKCKRILND